MPDDPKADAYGCAVLAAAIMLTCAAALTTVTFYLAHALCSLLGL